MVAKAFTLVILALSVLQCANAGYKGYSKKTYSVVQHPKVEYQIVKHPVVYTYHCIPKPVTLTAPPVLVCPSGSTTSSSGGHVACSKTECVKQAPKVVYTTSSKGHYGYGKSKGYKSSKSYKSYDKKYEVKKYQPVYVAKVAAPAKVATYVPQPDVCKIVAVAPVLVCEKGKLEGKVCIIGNAPGKCPSGWKADKDKCVKVETVAITQQVKYQSKGKGYYGYGKGKSGLVYGQYDKKYYDTKYGYQSNKINYCEDSYGH